MTAAAERSLLGRVLANAGVLLSGKAANAVLSLAYIAYIRLMHPESQG